MIYVMTIGAVALVVLAVVGVASAWGLSRLMDRANSSAAGRWKEALEVIERKPLAAGIYYGCRWVGICLLVGMLFSRAV